MSTVNKMMTTRSRQCSHLLTRRWMTGTSKHKSNNGDNSSSNVQHTATMRRLYRILQRQAQEINVPIVADTDKKENGLFLLHPRLDHHRMGQFAIIPSVNTTTTTTTTDQTVTSPSELILMLFGRWEEKFIATEQLRREDENEEYGDDDTEQAEREHFLLTKDEERMRFIRQWIDHCASLSTRNMKEIDGIFETLWTTPACLKQAIRLAFSGQEPHNPALAVYFSLRAYRQLAEQQLQSQRTSVSERTSLVLEDEDKEVNMAAPRVRVTCLARCVGHSLSTTDQNKYRFVYRIRIENIDPSVTVQLLGRSWEIHYHQSPSPHLTKNPTKIHAPQTGAVGSHAVLHPGQALEYMSGCDLHTPQGTMSGCFYMAVVPPGTPSAIVGEYVAALNPQDFSTETISSSNDDSKTWPDYQRFRAHVEPFGLHGNDAAAETDQH